MNDPSHDKDSSPRVMLHIAAPTRTTAWGGFLVLISAASVLGSYLGDVDLYAPAIVFGVAGVIVLIRDLRSRTYFGPPPEDFPPRTAPVLASQCAPLPGTHVTDRLELDEDLLGDREARRRSAAKNPQKGEVLGVLSGLASIPYLLARNLADPHAFAEETRHSLRWRTAESETRFRDELSLVLRPRIDAACKAGGLLMPPRARQIVVDDKKFVAEMESFFGAAELVTTSANLHVLIYLFGKAVAPLISAMTPIGPAIGARGPEALSAQARLQELLRAFVHEQTGLVRPYRPPSTWPFWWLAGLICESIELFVLAHEIGHIVLVSSGDSSTAIADEILADRFAATALYNDAVLSSAELPVALLGPVLFFHVMGVMEEAGRLPAPLAHPASSQRADCLVDEFAGLMNADPSLRDSTEGTRALWSALRTTLQEDVRISIERDDELRSKLDQIRQKLAPG